MTDIPAGYRALERSGPYLEAIGPLYVRPDGDSLTVALRIERRHLNIRGIAHGGLMVTLADSALGIVLSNSRKPRIPMVTVSLTTDFAGSAREGDWVEARVDIQKVGGRLAFANCYLSVGDARILRASGVFALMPPPKDAPVSEPRFDG